MSFKSVSVSIGFHIYLLILSVYSQEVSIRTTTDITSDENIFTRLNLVRVEGEPLQRHHVSGGTPTISGEFPFMAAFGWRDNSLKLTFHGAGMLISTHMILTAAHCVYKNGTLPDIVYIGGHPFSEIKNHTFNTFLVENVTIYPEYDPNQGYDDIALLELNREALLPTICLWGSQNLNANDVTAIGYGLTEFAGSGSEVLLKVNLTVFSLDYCEPFFIRQRKFKKGLSNAHICAGDKDGIKDTCQGDSGGPLMISHNSQMFAVGITSSGVACSGYPPGIYTKIFDYMKWITSELRDRKQSLKNCVT